MLDKILNWLWLQRNKKAYRALRRIYPEGRYAIWYSRKTGFYVDTWEGAARKAREAYIARMLRNPSPWICETFNNTPTGRDN